ncbi:unnamed protein product [Cyprideis torosa]|uniref:Uncharacterized protein n=1 Tax=Cyprideis torosa TaxID=163714 RepID=A0A7R8WMV0_9CRUS|nr:unnamed protein product [Cyprideis torosa]CAG0905569.1 unnamed protein product [Cyprideis torosa]
MPCAQPTVQLRVRAKAQSRDTDFEDLINGHYTLFDVAPLCGSCRGRVVQCRVQWEEMTSLRQRKSELSVGEEASPNDMKSFFIPRRRRSRALLRVFLVCAGLLIVLLLWNEYSPFRTQHGTTFIDKVSLYLGMQSLCYAVVIDAGSTGTRILGFRFHMNKIDGSLRLESSLWAEVKPGLSSYANNPDQVEKHGHPKETRDF